MTQNTSAPTCFKSTAPGLRRRIFRASAAGLLCTIAVIIATLWPMPARTQDVANSLVTATVQTAVTVIATQPLDFGSIFQGVPKAMGDNQDDSSAIFTITGQGGVGINIQLALPEYLSLADGSDRMAVVFRGTDAAVDTSNTATPSTMVGSDGWIDQNPYLLPTAAVIGSPGNSTRIYLGGRVMPSSSQKPGLYSGNIILSVSYNGL